MKIGETLYVHKKAEWRSWLRKHSRSKKEIWLIYYKQNSGKPRIPYNDAVDEALCFGWIDSILKPIDKEKYAQRYSPRREGSKISDMNLERIRRLVANGSMTVQGLAAVSHAYKPSRRPQRVLVAPDILKALRKDPATWRNYQRFPASYKRIRIGWIEGSRTRRKYFEQRLRYFLKMTAANKRFGMVK